MTDLIYGKTLVWASYDPAGVVTAAVHSVLQNLLLDEPTRIRLWRPKDPGKLLVGSGELGLAFWNLAQAEDAKPICNAVSDIRARSRGTVCVCFVDPHLSDLAPILQESGAQIVASELPFLLNALRRAVSAAPLSNQGFHPLTSGLLQRLPWPDASNDPESN